MPARVPLDVDLEDKLLYGLTPMRLAYLVIALLAGFAIWSSPWSPNPVRVVSCLTVIVFGVALAWCRWRARAADQWLADFALFVVKRYRFVWSARPRHQRDPS